MRLSVKGELSHRRCAPSDALALPAKAPIVESAWSRRPRRPTSSPIETTDGRLSKWLESLDLKEFAEFNRDLVAWMEAGLKAGKTPEQLAAEWKVPEKYKGYSSTVNQLMGGMVGRIQALQKEMQ